MMIEGENASIYTVMDRGLKEITDGTAANPALNTDTSK